MKFLCVACDEAMKFQKTLGPYEGSLTVIFRCPQCRRETALLTNPWETQVVQALDVKIGGQSIPSRKPPMEFTQSSLEKKGKCPFSSVVSEAMAKPSSATAWTQEAELRLEKIPETVRPMARLGIEQFARERGYASITPSVLDEAKERFGM